MKFMIYPYVIINAITFSVYSFADPVYQSDYIGQEKRKIKSLSADDIEQLKNGKGWGLAKAAELNGMPGPIHILQMKDKIALTAEQEMKVRALYESMKSKAVPLGQRLIQLESELNNAFASKTITKESLEKQLGAISEVRKQLRYVHLETHLMTPNILTAKQIDDYNRLRSYHTGDPCKNVPEGHDVDMWRKHNNCK